jgi:hypothetical protein
LLVQAAVNLVMAGAVTTILVATAAADIGNLRFYQRQGFRMRSVERDAFTPATGYPGSVCRAMSCVFSTVGRPARRR